MSRRGKATETKKRLVVARGCGKGDFGVTAKGYGVSFWGDENVLKLGGGDGSIT